MIVRTEVIVVGAGMSGLGQAVALRKAGVEFLVLEKADAIGGTWRDNTYPGASCDVESHLYSYSHDPNPSWSSTYAGQAEILQYLHTVAERHRLLPRIRFGVDITAARWDERENEWTTTTADGTTYVSAFLVLGVGGLHTPDTPELPGAADFRGDVWHSSDWNHDVDVTGKRVALVGVGASGVQVAPYLADRAASLTVFQRTAPWVLPKRDEPVPASQQRTFRRVPLAQRLHRLRIHLQREKRGIGFHRRPDALRAAEPIVHQHIERQVSDPALREKVTPTYPFGCKRVLFSNEYYAALAQPNVHVVVGTPAALRPEGIVDTAGEEHGADVIVYATGFNLTGSFDRIRIEGLGGRLLRDEWLSAPYTYNGVAVPGFPNMFVLLGPNGFVTYTGAVMNIEAQARYVVRAIRATRTAGVRALVVTPDAARQFQEDVGRRFERSVWRPENCTSWYQNRSASGTVVWPASTLEYRWRLRRLRRRDFSFLGKTSAAA